MPGFCVIEPSPPPEISSVLIVPEKAQVQQTWGTVVNAGVNAEFDAGDRVIFNRWAGAHFEMEDRSDLVLVKHQDVLAVIE